MGEINLGQIENAVKMILEAIGENLEREGLKSTPKRVAKMYKELFSGVNEDPKRYFKTVFESDHDDVVLVKDIPFYSMCEHHLLPFFGHAHIAYFPQNGKVAGLSKLARAVDSIAKRPQLQERLTESIAGAIMDSLTPLGVMAVVEAEHMCMAMRGIKKPGSVTVTVATRGIFLENPEKRNEIFHLIKNR